MVTSVSRLPAIRLVERDGNLHTVDNRRMVAFRKSGLSETPYTMATPEEAMTESWKSILASMERRSKFEVEEGFGSHD
jgi:hypothetical protein